MDDELQRLFHSLDAEDPVSRKEFHLALRRRGLGEHSSRTCGYSVRVKDTENWLGPDGVWATDSPHIYPILPDAQRAAQQTWLRSIERAGQGFQFEIIQMGIIEGEVQKPFREEDYPWNQEMFRTPAPHRQKPLQQYAGIFGGVSTYVGGLQDHWREDLKDLNSILEGLAGQKALLGVTIKEGKGSIGDSVESQLSQAMGAAGSIALSLGIVPWVPDISEMTVREAFKALLVYANRVKDNFP